MSWIPDPGPVLVLIVKLQRGEGTVVDAAELCWLFLAKILDPGVLEERLAVLEDLYHSGAFTFADPEIADLTQAGFQSSEGLTKEVSNRLRQLTRATRPEYVPDGDIDSTGWLTYAYLQGARVASLTRNDGLSEEAILALEETKSALAKVELSHVERGQDVHQVLVDFLKSFLNKTAFDLERVDGRYDLALVHLVTALGLIHDAKDRRRGFPYDLRVSNTQNPDLPSHGWLVSWEWDESFGVKGAPWLEQRELKQQAVDSFEAVKSGRGDFNREAVLTACALMTFVWEEVFGIDSVDDVAVGNESIPWESYWDRAVGWTEGQNPSVVRELIEQAQDHQARKRLEAYFFRGGLWSTLPDRAQRALVSADREWVDGKISRGEALLNELRVATEEMLRTGLWDPMLGWCRQGQHGAEPRLIARLRSLVADGRAAGLVQLADLCRSKAVSSFLADSRVRTEHVEFITKELPKFLRSLQKARNEAEHESSSAWPRERLASLYAESVARGEMSFLPRLAKALAALPQDSGAASSGQ